MDGIDLNDVATFVRVAEGGAFTAAARTLGVPKSTVSRALARLEKQLGVRLVQRTTRAVALTDAGRAYYERVRGAVAGLADATADVVDMGAEPRGTIRITAPVDMGEMLLGEVIVRFTEKYPQVRFEVSLTSRIVDLVAEGFDLAIRASPLADSSLVARKLLAADLGLFAAKTYLTRRGAPSVVADLASHDFVRFRAAGFGPVLALHGADGAEEQVEVHGTVEADDMLFVQRLIHLGAGIGLMPLFFNACTTRAKKQGIVRVLPDWVMRGGAVNVVAPSARHEPRRVKLFREFLLAHAKQQGFPR
jgi:DNA-binding transcriptional LysR family regulator